MCKILSNTVREAKGLIIIDRSLLPKTKLKLPGML
jgi:hypothetical protein